MPKDAVHLELDFEAMRTKVLEEQWEAMKPFQKRLADIDVAQAVVNREHHQTVRPYQPEAHQVLTAKEYKKLPHKKYKKPKLIPQITGVAYLAGKPFQNMTQDESFDYIFTMEDGLTSKEIAHRMVAGGYPFDNKNFEYAAASVTVALGKYKKKTEKIYSAYPNPRMKRDAPRYYRSGNPTGDK